MAKTTIAGLMRSLARMPEVAHAEMQAALTRSAVKVRDTATNKFGSYQPAAGPYPAWAKLKPATVKRKLDAGGGEDPLIGHYRVKSAPKTWPQPLRNTIGIKVDVLSAAVGTDDPIGKYHEYGAPAKNIPPRPFLRPSLYENQDEISNEMAMAMEITIRQM